MNARRASDLRWTLPGGAGPADLVLELADEQRQVERLGHALLGHATLLRQADRGLEEALGDASPRGAAHFQTRYPNVKSYALTPGGIFKVKSWLWAEGRETSE